jgi:radical SAM protein with 4Fe4S-binding SPASM domain
VRLKDCWDYLRRAPKLSWNILFRGRYNFTYDLMPISTPHMPVMKRLNLLKTGANLIYRRGNAWGWPVHVHVELTNYCNLKCRVCPTGTGRLRRRPAAMDPALFERLMNEAGPYLLTTSLWGWGESLLHPQLTDMLRLTQNRGVTTFLSTNGQNLDDEKVLQALISYPPTYLIVCIDGLTDETNSVFRVGAKLEPVLTGVRQLAQMKRKKGSHLPILHLQYIVMKHNEHEVPQLPQFAAANRFDQLTTRTLVIIDAPDDVHHDLIPDDEGFRAYGYRDNKRISRTDFICEKAFIFPAVFADGTVVACDQDCNAQQPYGSLADGSSFADIWWSKRANEIRRTIRNNPDSFSFCRNCPFRDRPVGACSIQYVDLHRQGIRYSTAPSARHVPDMST